MGNIKKVLAVVMILCIVVSVTGCSNDKGLSFAESTKAGFNLLMGDNLPEGKALEFTSSFEKNGINVSVSGIRSANEACVSLKIDHSKIYYDFIDIYKRVGETVYLNMDMVLNLAEYFGFVLSDSSMYSGKTVSIKIDGFGEKLKQELNSAFVSFEEAHKSPSETNEGTETAEAVSPSPVNVLLAFADSLNGRADGMAGLWNSALALIYEGEHKAEVAEIYEMFPRLPSSTLTLPARESGRAIHESILASIREYAELIEDNPSAKITESASYTEDKEIRFNYTAVSEITTREGNDESGKITISAKEIGLTDEFVAKCKVSDANILPTEKFLSVLKSNLNDMINAVYESEDFPYSMTVDDNTLVLSQANDMFSETLSYLFLNGRLNRLTASYKTNSKTAHNMLMHKYESLGFVLIKDESEALDAGEGQGVLVYEGFTNSYDTIENPAELLEVIQIEDTPLYKGFRN